MSGKCGTVDHISRICEVCKVNPMINDLNIPLKMPHIGYTNWFLLLCYLPCVGTCGLRTCTTWLNKKASERKRAFSMLFYGPCVTEIKSATDPAKQRFSFPSQLLLISNPAICCNSLSDSAPLFLRKLAHKLMQLLSKHAVVTSLWLQPRPLHHVYIMYYNSSLFESLERDYLSLPGFYLVLLNQLPVLSMVGGSIMPSCLVWCFPKCSVHASFGCDHA